MSTNDLKNDVSNAANIIKHDVKDIGQDVQNDLRDVTRDTARNADDLLHSTMNESKGALQSLKDTVSDLLTDAKDTLANTFSHHSAALDQPLGPNVTYRGAPDDPTLNTTTPSLGEIKEGAKDIGRSVESELREAAGIASDATTTTSTGGGFFKSAVDTIAGIFGAGSHSEASLDRFVLKDSPVAFYSDPRPSEITTDAGASGISNTTSGNTTGLSNISGTAREMNNDVGDIKDPADVLRDNLGTYNQGMNNDVGAIKENVSNLAQDTATEASGFLARAKHFISDLNQSATGDLAQEAKSSLNDALPNQSNAGITLQQVKDTAINLLDNVEATATEMYTSAKEAIKDAIDHPTTGEQTVLKVDPATHETVATTKITTATNPHEELFN